ncbi:MAG: hypothetical protein QMC83_03995 [Thermodesulfovibrionales bacterium]|nr:hypothetical protein [Thermodesulfovibrionales bacterium]
MNYLAVLLDSKRISDIKGSPLESKVTDMFGGAIKALIIEVPENLAGKIIENLPGARLDARFFIEEAPIAFKRALFEKIKTMKSIGAEVIDAVLTDLPKIKELAAKESESLPIPDVDISEALGLQKKAA